MANTALPTVVKGRPTSSWRNMPPVDSKQNQWQQPEVSVGESCGSLGMLGRIKYWLVKDKSPVALAWKTISSQIRSYLEDQNEHLIFGDSPLIFEIFMIGRKPENSSPTILFSCENKESRLLAIDLVHKKGILASYPGILMAGSSRSPRQLAGEERDLLRLPLGVYLNGPVSGCGISILVSHNPKSPPRKATLGGILCIENQYYGLTTAHSFMETVKAKVESNLDDELVFYHLGEPDESSEDEGDSAISIESIYSRSVHSIDAEDFDDRSRRSSLSYATESTYRNSDYTGTQVIQKREKPIRIGSYFASSTLCSQGSLDWALVYIEPLFYLTHQELLTNSVLVKGRSYTPRSLKSVAVDARVLICTGADGSALEGKLSGVASFTRAPASKRFQELWTVQMIEGNFVDGDCGSWVVDFGTMNLFGHIVSGYPGSRTASIAPAGHVFQDIQRIIGKQVELNVFRDPCLLVSPWAALDVPGLDLEDAFSMRSGFGKIKGSTAEHMKIQSMQNSQDLVYTKTIRASYEKMKAKKSFITWIPKHSEFASE